MDNVMPKPTYGYTLDNPEKGKRLFYMALAMAISFPLYFIAYRIMLGSDGMHAWWEAGKLDLLKSPIVINGAILTNLGIALIICHSVLVKGWKRTVACISVGFLIAWFYEYLGTNADSGGAFGPYHYNPDTLGGHVFGVPWGVALGWEVFAYPAFYLVLYLMPSEELGAGKSIFKRISNVLVISTLGGLFCLATDLLSDPLAVEQGFFTWHVNGAIYPWLSGSGEPLSNFTGWFICGFSMMFAWYFILQGTPSKNHNRSKYLDIYFPLALYAAHFTNNFSQALFLLQRDDVILFGGFGHGGILLILLVKLYQERQGAQANPLAKMISQEALSRLQSKGTEFPVEGESLVAPNTSR